MSCAKVALLIAFMAVAAMADDSPYSYRPPQPRTYRPPQSRTYKAPEPESYEAPEPTYSAPRQAYKAPEPSYKAPESYENEVPKYDFTWQVDEDYNKFGQQEDRDGYKTQGSYSVNLPDGRVQTVTYYVDGDSGFVAEVSYSGEARYPESNEYKQESVEAYQPAYQPPRRGYN